MTTPEPPRGVVPLSRTAGAAARHEIESSDQVRAEEAASTVDAPVEAAPAAQALPQAAPAVQTATTLVRPGTAATAPSSVRPPDRDRSTDAADERTVAGRPARLRIGSHTASRAALAAMSLVVPPPGLVVGVDRRQQPVPVRFFRAQPMRVTMVGGAWAGQLVVFRALALGARVAVITAEPALWDRFGEWATGRRDRVVVYPDERPLAFPATPVRPALVVYDLGVVGPTAAPPPSPWQTQLTILRALDRPLVAAVLEAQLVLLQRLSPLEAAIVGAALRLPAANADFIQMMAHDMLALHGEGPDQYAWLALTDVERQYFGEARR